jgi:hypothetical protein
MALALNIIEANYKWVDVENGEANVSLFLPAATTLADSITFFDAIGDAMNSISGCVNPQYQIILHCTETAYIAPSSLEDNIEYVAVFQIATADDNEIRITIPSVDEDAGFYESDDLTINQSDATIIPFLDMLIDGDGTVAPCDQRGVDFEPTSGATGTYRILASYKAHVRSHVSRGARAG